MAWIEGTDLIVTKSLSLWQATVSNLRFSNNKDSWRSPQGWSDCEAELQTVEKLEETIWGEHCFHEYKPSCNENMGLCVTNK